MIRFLILLALGGSLSGAALAAGLDGVYDADPRLCGLSSQSTTRLKISGQNLSLYKDDCVIRSASAGHLRLQCNDGVQNFSGQLALVQQKGGIAVGQSGQRKIYRRCP